VRVLETLRGGIALFLFAVLTFALMPFQILGLWLHRSLGVGFGLTIARGIPVFYHRLVCRLLGVRIQVHGAVERGKPVLLLSNHVSWLDIPVLSTIAPVSFVAKREVGQWPGVSVLANLQRSLFIDRNKRSDVKSVGADIAARLALGDVIVVFPEGTSTDGNGVAPFRSSLLAPFAALAMHGVGKGAGPGGGATAHDHAVQLCAIAYTHRDGMPLGRAGRPDVAWYGDMELPGHAWSILSGGPITVQLWLSEPIPAAIHADRKALAAFSHDQILQAHTHLTRQAPAPDAIAAPQANPQPEP